MSEFTRFNKYINEILQTGNLYVYGNDEKHPHMKELNVRRLVCYTIDRTSQIFRWNNLPDTIPQRMLELYLQMNGNCCITEVDGSLYALTGGLGGTPDPYYMPTLYTVANPALHFNRSLKIHDECVVIPNDTMYMGLLPLINRYCTMMVETDLSMYMANINSRIMSIIDAGNDRYKTAAEIYLRNITDGKLGAIATSQFLRGINTQPYSQTAHQAITDLIELMQYTKASLFNELGLNANYNMKRESLNSAESQLNNDALVPFVDDMLQMRQIACDEINKLFGTNISVELASSWEDNEIEIDAEQDILLHESEDPSEEDPSEEDPSEEETPEEETSEEDPSEEETPEEEPSEEETPEEESSEEDPSEETLQDIEDKLQDIEDKLDEVIDSEEGETDDEATE